MPGHMHDGIPLTPTDSSWRQCPGGGGAGPKKLLDILDVVRQRESSRLSPDILDLITAQISMARQGNGNRWPPRYAHAYEHGSG